MHWTHHRMTPTKKRIAVTAAMALVIVALMVMPGLAAKPRLTDIAITDAVEDELLMDSAVRSHQIDVTTHDGIVTLAGSVDNILAKERSARIARIVKGVRAVVNKLEVFPPLLRTDKQIHEDVTEALLIDPATDSFEIDVKVKDNVVTLTGSVESWQEKELCGIVAKGIKGVKGVNNEILVSWPETRSDREIRAEVQKTLEWDAFVEHALINVEVRDAKVTLSGTVGSAAEKDEAYWDAYVHGVKSVDASGLKVERWARDEDLKGQKYAQRTANEIKEAVKDALMYDPRVFSFDISVEVVPDTKTAVLRGSVDNLKARRAAAQDARNTVGVLSVDNRIKVRLTSFLSDHRVEERVRRALLRHPYVKDYQITVDVTNGVAELRGTVDSNFEKSQADDMVSRVNGVIMVDNNLIVQEDYDPYIHDPYVDDGSWYDYDWYRYRPTYPISKTDRQIKEDIEDEFFWSPFVDADDVNVTVDDGKAILTGTVDSWSEYNSAASNAYEGGAVYVDNELVVQ